MIPLRTRVDAVAGAALTLDPWTRLAIRDRLILLGADADPRLRHLLSAAASWLAAVSYRGEQVQSDGEVMFLMPPQPHLFTGTLAHCDDLDALRRAIGLALIESDHASGVAHDWWHLLAQAFAAAAAAIEDALCLGTELDDWRLE